MFMEVDQFQQTIWLFLFCVARVEQVLKRFESTASLAKRS